RLARAGQPHQHTDLPVLYGEAGVGDPDDDAGALGDLGARGAGVESGQRLLQGGAAATLAAAAEQDVNLAKLQRHVHGLPDLALGRLMRSRMIASSTMTNPASKP